MKKLLLFIPALLTAFWSFGQCEPMTDFGNQSFGVAPDTVTNFVDGEINTFYTQQIDVKIPADTTIGGFPVSVDSAEVTSIDGLPVGLTLSCNGNATLECMYLSDTVGCAVITGIPTEAGNFDLIINLNIYTGFGTLPFSFTGYHIFIDGTSGIATSPNLNFSLLDARPNPAHGKTTIEIATKKPGNGRFRVFDMVGKEVYTQNLMLTQGSNKVEYNTTDLPEGVYIYRVDAFDETMTSRLIVVH